MAGISFRPAEQTERALVVLMERWRCGRSQAINRAIQEAGDPPEMVSVESPRVGPLNLTKGATVKLASKVQDISATKKVLPAKPGRPQQGKTTLTGRPFGAVPK